eukprot:6538674-Prorocentrum_lima.AAC.1
MSQEQSCLEALEQELQNAVIPVTTPAGEHVQSASNGHARVDERRARSLTPTRRTPPSPREKD